MTLAELSPFLIIIVILYNKTHTHTVHVLVHTKHTCVQIDNLGIKFELLKNDFTLLSREFSIITFENKPFSLERNLHLQEIKHTLNYEPMLANTIRKFTSRFLDFHFVSYLVPIQTPSSMLMNYHHPSPTKAKHFMRIIFLKKIFNIHVFYIQFFF